MSQISGITGVPSMIVNGKYISDAPMAGGQENLLKAVDFLILKESEK
jgi:thiol:disulfide interchange protein DsbA